MNAAVCKTVVIQARRDTGAQLHFSHQHGGYSVIVAPDTVNVAEPERNRLVSPLSAAVPGSEARVPSLSPNTRPWSGFSRNGVIVENQTRHSSTSRTPRFQRGEAGAAPA